MTAPRHRQVPVPYDGRTVEVDEGLAELLPVVWAHGARTTASCADDGGEASITFVSPADAVVLLNLATDEDTPELPDWTYTGEAVNRSADTGGPPDHTFRMTVRFPIEHIEVALDYARAKPCPTTEVARRTRWTPRNTTRIWRPQGRGAGRGGT